MPKVKFLYRPGFKNYSITYKQTHRDRQTDKKTDATENTTSQVVTTFVINAVVMPVNMNNVKRIHVIAYWCSITTLL